MYKNILVINLMQIGDLMLTTPVLGALRAAYPQAKITLLADSRWRELVECNPHVDACLFMDKKGRDKGIRRLLSFVGRVRKMNFDLVINLHRNERSSAIAAMSGAPRIVGYSKPPWSLLFDKVLKNPSLARRAGKRRIPGTQHQVHSHMAVLKEALGIEEPKDVGLVLCLSDSAAQTAEELWQQEFSPADKVIAFNIGASWETKRWLTQYFAQAADMLIEKGYHIAFFGGPMDKDIVAECQSRMEYKDSGQVHIFTGRVSLAVLAGLLRRCVLMLTTDSGPMHIGVAMNLPLVTMFGASPVPGFYPYDGRSVLVKTPEKCHPCGIHQCQREGEGNLACMKNIPVAAVMNFVWELLDKYHGEPAYKLPPHYGDYQCRVIDLSKGEF